MADASYPDDVLYHPDHDWARIDDGVATFGITWFAQDALGEVVFFDPPEVGSSVTAGEFYAEVESVKAVSELFAPVSGQVTAVNDERKEHPEQVNQKPHETWLVRIKLSTPAEASGLMDQSAYTALIAK